MSLLDSEICSNFSSFVLLDYKYYKILYLLADESNTTTSNGRMVIRIMTSVSQNEIEKCSERTKIGLSGSIKQGHLPSKTTLVIKS